MINQLVKAIFGSKSDRDIKTLVPIVQSINQLEPWAMELDSSQFAAQTLRLKEKLAGGAGLDDIMPEAFALAREAARRTLGERIYDVQLMGGIVLHQGRIMEMKTGEGKTLSSVPAAYLNALSGKGVHVVTVNDYLAERDAGWMRPIFAMLGLSVGAILSHLDTQARKAAYDCDITYGTNNEFGFDYLRDNMCFDLTQKVQRSHSYCIIDEIDSILIDEARTPLIISGQAEDDTARFVTVNRLVSSFVECEKDPKTGEYPEELKGDYKIDEKGKRVVFTDEGLNKLESLLLARKIISGTLFSDENFEYIHYMTQLMRAHHLYHRDKDYVVQDGQVQIVDEFTGRILHGRRYSEGLHQAIEAKENIRIAARNRTLATITFQNFFRLYDKIAGMTGTADTEAREFQKIYNLDVAVIPTNRPVRRKDEDDLIFLDEEDKFQAICDEIAQANQIGQPVLVGTISIEKSELLSRQLTKRGIKHEVLNAKNHAREALIVAMAGSRGAVTIATNMAGRGTDIKLGGNPDFQARRRLGSDATEAEYRAAFEQEYSRWLVESKAVRDAGGLYIIGTERHESRRIDNQLRGRSGRQGDPGRSRFFISLDDDLMRLFGGGRTNLKALMARVGLKRGEAINHPLLNRSIESAQHRVEERNFDIRKHLLEFDDVLNEQRKFIYQRRDEILSEQHLKERINRTVEETISDLFSDYVKLKEHNQGSLAELLAQLKTSLYLTEKIPTETVLADAPVRAVENLSFWFANQLAHKEALLTPDYLNQVIRFEYLRLIDLRWQDHLENLEALREAVYLRSYGQKNPLLEYKLEGFQIFDELLLEIRMNMARKFTGMRVQEGAQRELPRGRQPTGTAQHNSSSVFTPSRPAPQAPVQADKVQVQRLAEKTGRNDPCPCGSGRKYKHCHGA